MTEKEKELKKLEYAKEIMDAMYESCGKTEEEKELFSSLQLLYDYIMKNEKESNEENTSDVDKE